MDSISGAGARQVIEAPTIYCSGFSSSCLIDHVYTNFKIEKVNVVNYDISDHIPVVCDVSWEKTKYKVCYEKSVEEFSKFDVGCQNLSFWIILI